MENKNFNETKNFSVGLINLAIYLGSLAASYYLKNKRINDVADRLYKQYPDPKKFAAELKNDVKKMGSKLSKRKLNTVENNINELLEINNKDDYIAYLRKMVRAKSMNYLWIWFMPEFTTILQAIGKSRDQGKTTKDIRQKLISFSLDEFVNFAAVNESIKEVVNECPYKKDYLREGAKPGFDLWYSQWLKKNHPDTFENFRDKPKELDLADEALMHDIKLFRKLSSNIRLTENGQKFKKFLLNTAPKIFFGLSALAAVALASPYIAYGAGYAKTILDKSYKGGSKSAKNDSYVTLHDHDGEYLQ